MRILPRSSIRGHGSHNDLEVPAHRLSVRRRLDLRRPGHAVGRRRSLGERPRPPWRVGGGGPVRSGRGRHVPPRVVFGFLTAITGDFDLTQTWLLIGYALALFILVNGVTYHRSHAEKLKAAAAASPDDQPSDELRAIAGAPSVAVMNTIDGLA